MRVDSEKPYRQLMEYGVLATMREYPYREGQVVRVKHDGKCVGKAVVRQVIELSKVMMMSQGVLERLTRFSGFSTFEEWLEEAKKLNHGIAPRYVVIIKLLEGSEA